MRQPLHRLQTIWVNTLRSSLLTRVPHTIIALISLLVFLTSCTTRYTPPRSEVVENANKQGITLPSPEEERERFFSVEKENQGKLVSLLEGRSLGEGDPNYRIGGGDTLEINVFDVEELNVTKKVSRSGLVALPLIGAIQAEDRTVGELELDLAKRLKKFVRNPQVTVFVSEFGSQLVAVMGSVERPATYPLEKGENSILELIGRAGGVSQESGGYVTFIPAESTGLADANTSANRARLALNSLTSERDPSESGIEIPLGRLLGTDGGIPIDVPVRGGDMIVVAKAGEVQVDGEVVQRGSFRLGGRMTVLGALAAAGGITYSAKVDEVEVIRDIGDDQPARLVLSLEQYLQGGARDVFLRDGDIVRVPSDSGRRIAAGTFEGITRLINFGVGGTVNLGQ